MADSGPRNSAPDLEILGDQVTLHPSGYVEPPEKAGGGDKERNLVEHMARFRSHPLEYAANSFPPRCAEGQGRMLTGILDFCERFPFMFLGRDGGLTITSLGNQFSITAFPRI